MVPDKGRNDKKFWSNYFYVAYFELGFVSGKNGAEVYKFSTINGPQQTSIKLDSLLSNTAFGICS